MPREYVTPPKSGATWDAAILDVEIEDLKESTVSGGRRYAVYAAESLVGWVHSYPPPKSKAPSAGLPPAARKKLAAKSKADRPRSRWHHQSERELREASEVHTTRLEAIACLLAGAKVPGASR